MKLPLKTGKSRFILLYGAVPLLIVLYYVWLFCGNQFLPLPIYLITNVFLFGIVIISSIIYVTFLMINILSGRLPRILGLFLFLIYYPGFWVLFITSIWLQLPVDAIQAGDSRIHLSGPILWPPDPWTQYQLYECDHRDRNCEFHETFAVPRGIHQRSMSVNEMESSIKIVINDVYEYRFDLITNEFFEINGISR
jgi:hypothetical protein